MIEEDLFGLTFVFCSNLKFHEFTGVNTFFSDIRFHSILFMAPDNDPNILQPKYIKEIYATYKKLQSLRFGEKNESWKDFCFKMPIVQIDLFKKRRKRNDDEFSAFEGYLFL